LTGLESIAVIAAIGSMGMTMDEQKYWFRAKRYGWGWGLPIT
jgi:hypothetical protein